MVYVFASTMIAPQAKFLGGFHHLLNEFPLRNYIPVAAPQARNFFGDISIIKGFSK